MKGMKPILVVLTGGTIGSRIGTDAINVNPEAAYSLIHYYNKCYGEDTTFEVIQPLNVLSENMTPSQWNILISTLNAMDFSKYQGVVVTHGSDTLAYSAALLGLLYGRAGIPVGVVAANYALEDSRSNGISNFRGAVSFIKNEALPGVFTFYEDNQGKLQVYLATRLVEADCYEDQFAPFGGQSLGIMKEDRFVENQTIYNPTTAQLREQEDTFSSLAEATVFTENVMLIRSYPGLNYSFFDWNKPETTKPAAVLVVLYHSATTCVSTDAKGDYSLVTFAKRCQAEGIPVYAASFKSRDMKFYASINTFLETGVKPLCNISTEAAYMKLMIACNQIHTQKDMEITQEQTTAQIDTMMEQNLFFETLNI